MFCVFFSWLTGCLLEAEVSAHERGIIIEKLRKKKSKRQSETNVLKETMNNTPKFKISGI